MTVLKMDSRSLSEMLRQRLTAWSVYTSPGFADLWASLGGRAVWWLAGEPASPRAVLSGVEFGRGITKRFQAMPDGCYCEPWVESEANGRRESLDALLRGLGRGGYMRVHLADFHNQFPVTAGFQARRFETALVEMADANWWPPDKTLQSEIRKAEREGVQPISFDPGRHMAEFLQLMTHTEQRHGRRPKYPAAFFERLARLAEQDERVAWRVVEHDGRLAASHIYLQSGRQLLNWQVYFDKQYSFLKPNQCLLFHAARTAAARGLRYLNLGATPNDAVSLADYKRKWGGAEYRYPCLVRESWLGRLL